MNVCGPGRIVLDLTRAVFDSLMLALGYATGAMVNQCAKRFARSFTRTPTKESK